MDLLDAAHRSKPVITRMACAWVLVALLGTASIALGGPPDAEAPTRLVIVATDGLAPAVIDVLETEAREPGAAAVEVKGQTTGGGPAELIDGRASVLVTVQPWTREETAAFAARHGYEPLRLKVATAQPALHVHRDNPVGALSPGQVDAIYSRTRRCGARETAETWSDVGVSVPGVASLAIVPYLQEDLEGMVRAHLLCGGDFRPDVARMASAVDAVSRHRGGIAIALRAPGNGVKALPLALRWDVNVYVNRSSPAGLPPPTRAFLLAAFGAQGREAFARAGLEPVPPAVARDALQALDKS